MRLDTIIRRVLPRVRRGEDIYAALDAVLARPVSTARPWPLASEYPAADVLILARVSRAAAELANADGAVDAAEQVYRDANVAWCAEVDRRVDAVEASNLAVGGERARYGMLGTRHWLREHIVAFADDLPRPVRAAVPEPPILEVLAAVLAGAGELSPDHGAAQAADIREFAPVTQTL